MKIQHLVKFGFKESLRSTKTSTGTINILKLNLGVGLLLFFLVKVLNFGLNSVPTQKISRLLTTSATACNRLLMKAEIMDVDIAALELQEAQVSILLNVNFKSV